MKKLFLLLCFAINAIAMETEKTAIETQYKSVINNKFVVLQVEDKKLVIDQELLPEEWSNSLKQFPVKEHEELQKPILNIIKYENFDAKLLPLVKKLLSSMQFSGYSKEDKEVKAVCVFLKSQGLDLVDLGQLLGIIDYLNMPKPILLGAARLFAEISKGDEIDINGFSENAKKSIDRYYYLLYGKFLAIDITPEINVKDLMKFKIINKDKILLNSVRQLQLANYYLTDLIYLEKLLKVYQLNFSSITVVDFSDNCLTKIPWNLLKKFVSLYRLNLKNNLLVDLSYNALKDFKDLRVIDLSCNKIREVATNFFQETSIWQIKLQHNKLKSLPLKDLAKMQNLKVLCIVGNDISWHQSDLDDVGRLFAAIKQGEVDYKSETSATPT